MANIERLQEVMTLIEDMDKISEYPYSTREFPQNFWYQGAWIANYHGVIKTPEGVVSAETKNVCGTAACFAGHAVLLYSPVGTLVTNSGVRFPDHAKGVAVRGGAHGPHFETNVGEYAKDLLGLTDDEADELFSSDNSKEDLRRIVNRLIETQKKLDEQEADRQAELSKRKASRIYLKYS